MRIDRDIPTPKEALLFEAITEVDAILSNHFSARIPGGRKGMCNVSASHMKTIGEKFGLKVRSLSAWELHKVFFGQSSHFEEVFDHTLTIVPEQMTLVDLTFCQFLHRGTPDIYADEGFPSGRLQDSPVAIGLLGEGYVDLTDESLKDYLRITRTGENKGYIESATVAELSTRGVI